MKIRLSFREKKRWQETMMTHDAHVPRVPATPADPARRGILVSALGAGLALCLGTARATVVTDATGLTAGEVAIPVADGQIPAYRAMPAGGSNLPVLLVVEEIFGVHEHIKDMCRRFAKHGYLAVAPELYARLGDVTKMADIDQVLATVNREPDVQAFSDLDATLAWAGAHGGDPGRAGVVGFCRGGRMVWMYAGHDPNLRAAVAWYGPLAGAATPTMPHWPVEIAAGLKVPVLGLYGALDQSIPQDDVAAMRQQLALGSSGSEIVVYPDAGHGFNADYRPSYVPADAADAMYRALAWLDGHGL
jgi:carboxymethylenebutenolidase